MKFDVTVLGQAFVEFDERWETVKKLWAFGLEIRFI